MEKTKMVKPKNKKKFRKPSSRDCGGQGGATHPLLPPFPQYHVEPRGDAVHQLGLPQDQGQRGEEAQHEAVAVHGDHDEQDGDAVYQPARAEVDPAGAPYTCPSLSQGKEQDDERAQHEVDSLVWPGLPLGVDQRDNGSRHEVVTHGVPQGYVEQGGEAAHQPDRVFPSRLTSPPSG